ncbi:MAG: DUF547 domain-containing protein [Phycisphaerae bacterium]|nr:DUF547 domain-containing protein [Phycisphaerae bacterium]
MKNFRLIFVSFITVLLMGIFCSQSVCAAAVNRQKNDVGNHTSDKNADVSDSNSELLSVVEPQDSNMSDDYISGDAFNLEFSEILREYVDADGRVNYAKLRRYRIQLNQIVVKLADIKPEVYITWSRNEKIAFWLNTYNICTLKGIIDNYPISPSRVMLLFYPADSVMHIRGMRNEIYFMIMGIQYTLDEIERDILLARFDEPRICFAVSYGTLGSAPLRNEPYMGKLLEQQLDGQVRNYFIRAGGLKIDESNNVVYISPLFKMYPWRQDAFIKRYGTDKLFRERSPSDAAILNFIKDYVSDPNADFLKRRQYSIEYIKYNWQLNAQPQTKNQ